MQVSKNQNYTIFSALLWPLVLSLSMWLVYKFDVSYKLNLYQYGLLPRKPQGLLGILTTPLIHDTKNNYHVFENTIALLFFGTFLFYFYRKIALLVLFVSWLLTGIIVWLAAKQVYHVGMSGVIYALAFFLITSSIIRKNRQLTALNFLIIFLYGSIFWGLFPLLPNVSWESHVYGGVSGLLLGLFFRKFTPHHVYIKPPIEDDPADDADDAWWKTGVIKDKSTEIIYEFKPKDNTSSNDKSE